MDTITLVMMLAALILGLIAYRRPGRLHVDALNIASKQAVQLAPRIVMALLVSGLFSVVAPTGLVAERLGPDSGMIGILTASVVGGLVPGGPMICFPLALILQTSGAGPPQLVALLTAWSVFAFHRIVAYELPMMGARFSLTRLTSSLILPPLAGILAWLFSG